MWHSIGSHWESEICGVDIIGMWLDLTGRVRSVGWTSLACGWAAKQTLSFSSGVKVEERITYISC
jgi:hypothetical protein